MIFGRVRGYMPRVSLILPGMRGPMSVEFIVDTGFEGDLSLPGSLFAQIDAGYATDRLLQMVDGSIIKRRAYLIDLEL